MLIRSIPPEVFLGGMVQKCDQDPGTLGPTTRNPPQSLKVGPGTPLKFKSGTPGPPSKFKSRIPGPPSKFKSGAIA